LILVGVGAVLATGLGISPTSTAAEPRVPEAMTTPHRAITVSMRRAAVPVEPARKRLSVVLDTIRHSGGIYVWAGASLSAADCSGLVSVAQSLAMGQKPHRIGDTHSLLAGQWPGAIPGAKPGDRFIIGVSPTHMVAMVDGVRLESRSRGMPYLIGDQAASPWDKQFTAVYHIDPRLLTNL
jgi:cell wall-associated NlpC family hydrolase